jgi:hypothetical protein
MKIIELKLLSKKELLELILSMDQIDGINMEQVRMKIDFDFEIEVFQLKMLNSFRRES